MTRAPLLLAAVLAALPACEDSTPVQRGFASRQVTQLRDRTLRFQGARGDLVLYSTVAADATHYWSVDIRTGAVREHDEMFTDVPVPQYTFPADPNARFHCSFGSDAMGRSQLQIDDAQTGQRTTVDGVDDNGGCPSESDPTIKLWRRDSSDHLTLWSGRYDDLQMVPIDLTVTRLIQDFRATDVSVVDDRQPARAAGRARALRDRSGDVCGHGAGPARARRAARGPMARRLSAPSNPRACSPTRTSTARVWRGSPTISVTGARWAGTVARRCSSDRSRPDRRESWRCSTDDELRPRAGFRRASRWKVPAADANPPGVAALGGCGSERDPRLGRRSAKAAHLPDGLHVRGDRITQPRREQAGAVHRADARPCPRSLRASGTVAAGGPDEPGRRRGAVHRARRGERQRRRRSRRTARR